MNRKNCQVVPVSDPMRRKPLNMDSQGEHRARKRPWSVWQRTWLRWVDFLVGTSNQLAATVLRERWGDVTVFELESAVDAALPLSHGNRRMNSFLTTS